MLYMASKVFFIVIYLCVFISSFSQYTYKKYFGGPSNDDWESQVIPLSDTSNLVVGSTDNFGAGYYDIYCTKLDKKGNMLFSKVYGTKLSETLPVCTETTDKGFLLFAGQRTGAQYNYKGAIIIKCNKNGDMEWSTHISSALYPRIYAQDIIRAKDGSYFLFYGLSNDFYDNSILGIIKLSSTGK